LKKPKGERRKSIKLFSAPFLCREGVIYSTGDDRVKHQKNPFCCSLRHRFNRTEANQIIVEDKHIMPRSKPINSTK